MERFVPAKIKAHSLTGSITFQVVYDSFRAVKRNRGAAGIDKVSIQMLEANLLENLCSVMTDLKNGSFEPLPLRRHFLDKGGGKLRPLGIPAVRDRLAQEVLRRRLTPIFEPLFHDASYGFRPGRNAHMALTQVLKHTLKPAIRPWLMPTFTASSITCPSGSSGRRWPPRSPMATSLTLSRNSFARA